MTPILRWEFPPVRTSRGCPYFPRLSGVFATHPCLGQHGAKACGLQISLEGIEIVQQGWTTNGGTSADPDDQYCR